jgi:glucose-6-phosphate 1-dehydrogenase
MFKKPGGRRGSLDSVTETYLAAKFPIDNRHWRGVPFYLRTGERLARQQSLVAIRFKHAVAFPRDAAGGSGSKLDRAEPVDLAQ